MCLFALYSSFALLFYVLLSPSSSALQELVLCKRRHVREQCGQAAAIFMRDHLPRITNPVLEQHCSAYTYGPGTCNQALYRRRYGAAHPLGVIVEGNGLRPEVDGITTSEACCRVTFHYIYLVSLAATHLFMFRVIF